MGWHADNTAPVLGALSSLGFVELADGRYHNSEEAQRYLVKVSQEPG